MRVIGCAPPARRGERRGGADEEADEETETEEDGSAREGAHGERETVLRRSPMPARIDIDLARGHDPFHSRPHFTVPVSAPPTWQAGPPPYGWSGTTIPL
jgi:hypothetical protein